jgi:hypothetical protein
MNGENGMSDIEGKAARGSSERVWARTSFNNEMKAMLDSARGRSVCVRSFGNGLRPALENR